MIKTIEESIPYNKIVDHLDIQKGDILLIGSDIFKLVVEATKHNDKFNTDVFIDSFQDKLTVAGTLAFPTFNWDFCSGKPFDIRNSPSKTGSLSSAALRRYDFVRTHHPLYSFAVWGKHSRHLQSLRNISAFGSDSPFAFFHKHDARMLIIGLDYQNSFTFVHYVEDHEQVGYRYTKAFSAEYIDFNGTSSTRSFTMYVRDLDKGIETNVNPMGRILEKEGIVHETIINSIGFKMVDLSKAFLFIQKDIRENQANNLYRIRS